MAGFRRTVAEHQQAVAALLPTTEVEDRELADCLGLVLASDIPAAVSLPPFDNSAMDGYALRSADVAGATRDHPVELPVPEDLPAGRGDGPPLQPGTAHRIMTGALMPEGADAIVKVEDTDGGMDKVLVYEAVPAGKHLRRSGEDVTAGDVVLPAGAVLGPAQLGVAAAVGLAALPVRRPVRVLVLSTGSELVAPGVELQRGQIYESNSILLASAARLAGATVQRLHFVPDDVDALDEALAPWLEQVDLLVTSGGVSAGAFEVVKDAMTGRGVEFGHVRMQPGGPQGVGTYRGVPVAALPGNPVSSSVSFEIFVRPAIRAAMGLAAQRRTMSARLLDPLESPAGLQQFRRATLDSHAGTVGPVGGPGSHLLGALARSNALVHIDEDTTSLARGDQVPVIPLVD